MHLRSSVLPYCALILGAIVELQLAGCGSHGAVAPATAEGSPLPRVAVTRDRHGAVHPIVDAPGIIAPYRNVLLSSTLSEPAVNVRVREGERVVRGEILAQLSTRDLRARLAAAVHTAAADESKSDQTQLGADLTHTQGGFAVRTARATLRQSEVTLRNDRLTLERDRDLLAKGFLPAATYDAARTVVLNDLQRVGSANASLQSSLATERINGTAGGGVLGAQVETARQQAASARAQASLIRAQIALATIVSPINGRVVNRNINVGEYPLGRAIFTLQQLSPAYADLNMSAADALRIVPGDRVTVQASNGSYPGHVVAVLGQTQPGGTNFTVKALIPDRRQTLLAGIPVHATIALAAARGITVPNTAFASDARQHVFVVRNGTVHEVRVETRASDAKASVVSGLPPGQNVIVNGQNDLSAGERVATR